MILHVRYKLSLINKTNYGLLNISFKADFSFGSKLFIF